MGNPKVILIESQECSTVTYREHLEARTARKIPTTPDCQCLRVENEISQIVGELIENSSETMYSIKNIYLTPTTVLKSSSRDLFMYFWKLNLLPGAK